MKQFTAEEIQTRFEMLPAEVQAAVTSSEVRAKIMKISDDHSLHVDQFGMLVDEIGLVMLGFRSSSMFTRDLVSELSISQKEADAIAREVSGEIFSSIRKHLQETEERISREEEKRHAADTISTLEKVGDLSIVKEPANRAYGKEVTSADRERVLEHLENPKSTGVRALNLPDNHTEPLVDHLLQNSVGQLAPKPHHEAPAPGNLPVVEETPLETGSIQTPSAPLEPRAVPTPTQIPINPEIPKTPPQPAQPKRSGPDPYRELAN